MAKAELTSTAIMVSTGVAGFGINNTLGKYFDEKTKQIKEYIKEEEDEWKNK